MTVAAAPPDHRLEEARAIRIEDEAARRGIKLRGMNERSGPCPACGGEDRFSINIKKQLWNCRGCQTGGDVIALVRHLDGVGFEDALETLAGRPAAKRLNAKPAEPSAKRIVTARFDYHDAHGAVVYQVERVEYQNPDGSYVPGKNGKRKKDFPQRRPDPDRPGEWIYNLGDTRHVLYRLPELLEALAHGRTIVIVEGEAKADLLWSWNVPATCSPMGAKNWRGDLYAATLRGADIVVMPDNDPDGLVYLDAVAVSLIKVGASVRVLDLPGLPPKGDVIDWAAGGGTAEQLHALIENIARPWEPPNGSDARVPKKPKMIIEWFGEAADSALSEPANQLIECVLDEGGLSVNYGDSGSGKTFVAIDMGFHVGAGLDWNGKKVRHGLVVYVAAEGGKRIKRRIAALQKRYREEYGDVAPDPLFALVRYPIDLRSSDADLNALIALVREAEKKTGHKCVWLIVDTLSRAMAGGDENSPVDMGRIVAAADRFRAETAADFTYVHHTGKDAARGARGHSLLRAATDTEIETTAGSLTVTKQRDGELGFHIGFKLVDLVIGDDPNGICVKSAVVEWKAVEAPAAKAKRELAPSKRLLMSVVDEALAECGFSFTPWADGPVVRCVRDSTVRDRYFTRIAEPTDGEDEKRSYGRKRKAWFRAVKAALDAKALMAAPYEEDRVLWKP
jgi:hypothetical protein